MEATIKKHKVEVNCHSSICLNSRIYFDPYNIKEEKHNADIIFLTHSHYDHCDMQSIERVMNSNTIIVGPVDTIEKVKEYAININNLLEVSNCFSGEINGVKYETFPSYNIGKSFHPKENGWVGYKIEIDGVIYTICGDCDATNELKSITTDVLFVPIGGKYTMNYEEGANLTNKIKPQIAIPVHYGSVVGSREDAEHYTKLVNSGIEVILLI